MSPPKYIYGSHAIAELSKEDRQVTVDILKKYHINHIDTAAGYHGSEVTLGEIGAATSFTIDTKSPSFVAKPLSRDSLTNGIAKSLSSLKTDFVDIYYLHTPDKDTPIEESVDTIQELHRQGKFNRFGLSNFLPDDVRKIHAYARSTGGIVPTVYQGNYNAFARTIEKDLFPLLRELGIAFYAYSPLAGGFFAKDPEDLANKKAGGRFDLSTLSGQLYGDLYNKATTIQGLREWQKLAGKEGISSVAMAIRWAVYHSRLDGHRGDAVILGSSRPSQLEQTLKLLEDGPLAEETAKGIEGIWKLVEAEAPLDNYNDYVAKLNL